MKNYLILFSLCLVIASGYVDNSFNPQWEDCHPNQVWVTHEVTLDRVPAPNKEVTFQLCGENAHFYVIPFKEMKITAGDFLEETVSLKDVQVVWKSHYCFEYTTTLPSQVDEGLVYNFTFVSIVGTVGCTNVSVYV